MGGDALPFYCVNSFSREKAVTMSHENVFQTNLATLANATELASKVIQKIAGEEIANTVDGKVLVSGDIKEAVAAKIQGCLLTGKGGSTQ